MQWPSWNFFRRFAFEKFFPDQVPFKITCSYCLSLCNAQVVVGANHRAEESPSVTPTTVMGPTQHEDHRAQGSEQSLRLESSSQMP